MPEQKIVIECPKCSQRLRIEFTERTVGITCPKCAEHFFWNYETHVKEAPLRSKRTIFSRRRAVIIGVAIAIAFITCVMLLKTISVTQPTKLTRSLLGSSKWVTVSYGDLLDRNAIVRTGQPLGTALADQSLRGAVQPFVDRYSYLLQHVVEMTFGADVYPHNNVVDYYSIGAAQPAWVAIFRGGRILVTTDNNSHARVFVIGDEPRAAYKEGYSIIRHCLSSLASPGKSSPLKVDVFAYKNDYAKSELSLCLDPFSFEATDFPPPSGKLPVDLIGLEEFFDNNGELEAAKLDGKKGLILYARKGSSQTVAGHNISLADFAVAYRAVARAGDNEAFISLDPHRDPTKVTVNFGGFLEDTRIGSVVLEADKRFKTITSGLDPNSFKDLRSYTRQSVPTFLTSSERDIVETDFSNKGNWVETRFWFYPESIRVDSDFSYTYAQIINPQFTADAERSRDDFGSPEEFAEKKKRTLMLSVRENIDHLNRNYAQYERAFTELKELTSVARLMAITVWLRKAQPDWLDVDELLSVDLPPFKTDREKIQMIAVTHASVSSTATDANYVRNNAKIEFITPFLDRTVKSLFLDYHGIAKYLCYKNGAERTLSSRYEDEAMNLMSEFGNRPVRTIIGSKDDLKAFASYVADRAESSVRAAAHIRDDQLASDKRKLEEIRLRIEEIEHRIKASPSESEYNSCVDEHNQLVNEYELIRQRFNGKATLLNKSLARTHLLSIVEIGGGINLEAEHFGINKTRESMKLRHLQTIDEMIGPTWSSIEGSQWIKSRAEARSARHVSTIAKANWTTETRTKSADIRGEHLTAGNKSYWVSFSDGGKSWHDLLRLPGPSYRERMYDASKATLHIAEFRAGRLDSYIIARRDGTDRIVFSKSNRQDVVKPSEPPTWWAASQ